MATEPADGWMALQKPPGPAATTQPVAAPDKNDNPMASFAAQPMVGTQLVLMESQDSDAEDDLDPGRTGNFDRAKEDYETHQLKQKVI